MNVQTGKVTAAISGEGQWSDPLSVKNKFNFTVYGTWAGTVTVQWSFDGGSNWQDIDTYTSNDSQVGTIGDSGILVRAGIKTGEYTSGTANIIMSD